MKRRQAVTKVVLVVLVGALPVVIWRATREPESAPPTISIAESCAHLAGTWCEGVRPRRPTTARDRVGTEQYRQQIAPWNACRNRFASRCTVGREPGVLTADQHERLRQAIRSSRPTGPGSAKDRA